MQSTNLCLGDLCSVDIDHNRVVHSDFRIWRGGGGATPGWGGVTPIQPILANPAKRRALTCCIVIREHKGLELN